MRIRRSIPSRKMKAMSFLEKKDLVARQIIEYRTKGYTVQDIANTIGVNVRVVERFCQQEISRMYNIDDVNYHRNLHIAQLETMLQSRLELALEGDNNAYSLALKTIEAVAGLKGMSSKRALQGVIEHNVTHGGAIGVDGEVRFELGEKAAAAAAAIQKLNAAEAKATAEVDNVHQPRFNLDKTLRKQLPEAQLNELDIVDAHVVEDEVEHGSSE